MVSYDGMRTWHAELLHVQVFNLSKPNQPSCEMALPLPCCSTPAGCFRDGSPDSQCTDGCWVPGGGRDYARPLQSQSGDWFMMIGCSTNFNNPQFALNSSSQMDGAVCRFKATGDVGKLDTWSFSGFQYHSNSTIFGQLSLTDEVPDFFELATPAGGRARHVLLIDPLGTTPCHEKEGCFPEGRTTLSHNIEWRTGAWSRDGSEFTTTGAQGALDYGMWYAPRSVADASNTGRRLIWGNLASDATSTAIPEHPVKRFFTSLPRELSLAADGKTVLVTPPPELAALRTASLGQPAQHELRCGDSVVLGEANATELELRINVSSAGSSHYEVGAFLLATAAMDEAAYVSVSPSTLPSAAFQGSNVAIDLRKTNNDTARYIANTTTGWPWQSVIPAPFAEPPSGVLQFRIFLDVNVVEVFAADCTCTASASSLADCECDKGNRAAVAVTALVAPSVAAGSAANRVGLFARCAGAGRHEFAASSRAWKLRPARFTTGPPEA